MGTLDIDIPLHMGTCIIVSNEWSLNLLRVDVRRVEPCDRIDEAAVMRAEGTMGRQSQVSLPFGGQDESALWAFFCKTGSRVRMRQDSASATRVQSPGTLAAGPT